MTKYAYLLVLLTPLTANAIDYCSSMDYAEMKDLATPPLLKRYCQTKFLGEFKRKAVDSTQSIYKDKLSLMDRGTRNNLEEDMKEANRCEGETERMKRVLDSRNAEIVCPSGKLFP